MKSAGKVCNGPMNKGVNVGGDLDHRLNTGKTCLGRGMHCHSGSSFNFFRGSKQFTMS